MEKQINTSRCDILVVLLLIISICVSLAGCTVAQDVSDPTGESFATEIPNTTSEDQILGETHSVTVTALDGNPDTEYIYCQNEDDKWVIDATKVGFVSIPAQQPAASPRFCV